MKYTISISDENGRAVSRRVIRADGSDLQAEEYRARQIAIELYRDAMHAEGKYPAKAG